MIEQSAFATLLQRVDALSLELQLLRRDLLRAVACTGGVPARNSTLFGSVAAGDITDEMVEQARRNLLRPLDDL